MIEIGYIGFSVKMIDKIQENKNYLLKRCVCEKKRLNEGILERCKNNNVELVIVESKEDVTNTLLDGYLQYYVMYEFGVILPKQIFETGNVRVFNFHPGSLLSNKGAHPIVWSVLNDEKFSVMSVYEVTAEIDAGEMVSQKVYEIDVLDGSRELKFKLESGIDEQLEALFIFLMEKKVCLPRGIMRRKVTNEDYALDLKHNDFRKLQTKILSQNIYNGAVCSLDGNDYWIEDIVNQCIEYKIIDRIGNKIIVERKEQFELVVNIDLPDEL